MLGVKLPLGLTTDDGAPPQASRVSAFLFENFLKTPITYGDVRPMGVHLLLFVFTFTPLCSHWSPLLSNHVNTGVDDIADEDAIFWVAHGEKAELTGGLELHMIEVGGHSSHQGSIRPLLHLHGGG